MIEYLKWIPLAIVVLPIVSILVFTAAWLITIMVVAFLFWYFWVWAMFLKSIKLGSASEKVEVLVYKLDSLLKWLNVSH